MYKAGLLLMDRETRQLDLNSSKSYMDKHTVVQFAMQNTRR